MVVFRKITVVRQHFVIDSVLFPLCFIFISAGSWLHQKRTELGYHKFQKGQDIAHASHPYSFVPHCFSFIYDLIL